MGGAGGTGIAGTGGTGGTGTAGTAGTAGTPSGAGTGGGDLPIGTASNLPGVDFQITEGSGADLELVSSNLTVDSVTNYVEWFAEVRNNGPKPACFVQVAVDFTTTAGVPIESLNSYAAGDPYEIGSPDSVSTCIGHGASGVVWANDIPNTAPTLADINVAKVKLTQSDLGATAVPHPSTPTLITAAITQHSQLGPGYWSLTGKSSAVATVYNVKADVYLESAAGLIVKNPAAFHLDTLTIGTEWDFETLTGYKGDKPTKYLFFWSFLNGAKGAVQAQSLNVAGLHEQVATAVQAEQAALALLESRRAQAERGASK